MTHTKNTHTIGIDLGDKSHETCTLIAKDNHDAARKLALDLIEHAESLDTLPLRWKVYPKFGNGQIHEIPYRGNPKELRRGSLYRLADLANILPRIYTDTQR